MLSPFFSPSSCKGFLALPQVIMAKQMKKYLKTLKDKMTHLRKKIKKCNSNDGLPEDRKLQHDILGRYIISIP